MRQQPPTSPRAAVEAARGPATLLQRHLSPWPLLQINGMPPRCRCRTARAGARHPSGIVQRWQISLVGSDTYERETVKSKAIDCFTASL